MNWKGTSYLLATTLGLFAFIWFFERHLGKSTKLGLSRGINALAKDGGLHYIPPVK